MKRIAYISIFTLFVISFTLLAGCIRVDISDDNGPTVTKTYDFSGFTGVEAGHAFNVDITRSDNYSITIIINEKVAERLSVSKIGDTLHIGFKEPVWNIHSRPVAMITLPDLHGLELSGASQGNVKGFKSSNDFDLEVSGASNLEIDMETGVFNAEMSGASGLNGHLVASRSDITVSGASHITLTGSGGNLKLESSGASHAYLENYAAVNAKIELSGASTGKLELSGRLDADLSGASHLEYSGRPVLGTLDISGASSLQPR